MTWHYSNKFLRSSVSYKVGKEGSALQFHENGIYPLGIGLGWDAEGKRVDSGNFDGNGNGKVITPG